MNTVEANLFQPATSSINSCGGGGGGGGVESRSQGRAGSNKVMRLCSALRARKAKWRSRARNDVPAKSLGGGEVGAGSRAVLWQCFYAVD